MTVLLIGDTTEDGSGQCRLPADWQVHPVATIDDALHALQQQSFDLILTHAAAVRQFAGHGPAGGRAEAETILRMIAHGVCTVDYGGALLWANPKFESYPPQATDALRHAAVEMCRELADADGRGEHPAPAHRTISVAGEFDFDITASPLRGPNGHVDRAVALVLDVTAARRLQHKLNAIDDAGRELVNLDAETLANMDVADRLRVLEEQIIRYSRELMSFEHFTVRVLDTKTRRLNVLLSQGMTDAARDRQIYASTEGNGISGYVGATGRSYICPDVPRDPRFLPGIENARSSLTVPLRLHDHVVGVLNVESDHIAAFTEDDRQIAEIFGRYIAVALHMLRLLAVERHATTGQVTADVIAELTVPLNDLVAQATGLMEDYIGHDDLRRRLQLLVDGVDAVQRRVHAIRPTTCVTGLIEDTNEIDPILANRRILIADDEDVIRETIAAVLARAGAITVMASDGDQATAMVRSQHFDLVISDINMPCQNGYAVFAAARRANPNCAVMLITGFGYDPEHSIVRASREGLSGVLFKPFKVERLMEEVHKALAPAPRA